MSPIKIALTLAIFLALAMPALAKRDQPTAAETVTLQTADGAQLTGTYWSAGDEIPAPGVLLIGSAENWQPLIQPVLNAGYGVVAAQVRGSGGENGAIDWRISLDDVEAWMGWLGQQRGVRPYGMALIGEQAGASVAINACFEMPDCATVIAVAPLLDAQTLERPLNRLYRYERNLPEMLLLVDRGDRQAADAAAQLKDASRAEVAVQLYDIPEQTRLLSAQSERIVRALVGWLKRYTAESAVLLDSETASLLALSMDNSVEMQPGETHDFYLGAFECCYVLTHVRAPVTWTVMPSSGAAIDPQKGTLIIDENTPPGSVFTVSANVERGRYTVSVDIHVFTPESNPLVGVWHEEERLTCDQYRQVAVSPSERIGEVVFNADGTFSVTWFPFEIYKDYWGSYTFDLTSHTLKLSVRSGNYVPPDIDPSGTFLFDDQGRLILQDLWLGTHARAPDVSPSCGHVLKSR
jgi:pimeloyl-ACP methyl ester carboxylesterase